MTPEQIERAIRQLSKKICCLSPSSKKFGVAGEDDMASENRSFSIDNYILQIKNGEGDSLLYFDDNNNLYFYGIAGDGPVLNTGMEVTPVSQLFLYSAQKKALSAVQGITDLVVTVGDVDNVGNGTKITVDDENQIINITAGGGKIGFFENIGGGANIRAGIGDVDQNQNETAIIVDDAAQEIQLLNVNTGTNTDDVLVIDGQNSVKRIPAIAPYSVYKGFLEQTGTNDPSIILLKNDIGVIVWSRLGPGSYEGVLTGAFANKQLFQIVHPWGDDGVTPRFAQFTIVDDNTISLDVFDIAGNASDNNGTSANLFCFELQFYEVAP